MSRTPLRLAARFGAAIFLGVAMVCYMALIGGIWIATDGTQFWLLLGLVVGVPFAAFVAWICTVEWYRAKRRKELQAQVAQARDQINRLSLVGPTAFFATIPAPTSEEPQ